MDKIRIVKYLFVVIGYVYCHGVFGQGSNIVPAQNFPPAQPSTEEVQFLEIKGEGTLAYLKDVVYVNRDGMDLHVQIITPFRGDSQAGKDIKFPCIVYIQGSAWMKQNVYFNLPQLVKFATRGFIIASVEYRHSELATFPAQVQDAKTAIRFMRKNAQQYHVDPDNIFVWGDSSGGHTALLVGISSGNVALDTEDYSEYSAAVNAIIDYYGPTDIVRMNHAPSIMNHSDPTSPEGLLIGGLEVLENQEKAQETNPINYISKEHSIPPVLIAHGDMDKLVPLDQSDVLAAKLKEAGKEFEFYCIKGAGHGTQEFWTNALYDHVELFIRKNLKN